MNDNPRDIPRSGEPDEEAEELEFAEWIEQTFDIRTIRNPYNEQTIMVLATVGPRAIMGGVMDMTPGLLPVYQPLMFAEVPTKIDEATKRIMEIGPQFTKHFMLLQVLDWMMFRVDSLYIMKANRAADMALVEQYERAVKAVQGQDSDIEIVAEMPSDLLRDNVRPLGPR